MSKFSFMLLLLLLLVLVPPADAQWFEFRSVVPEPGDTNFDGEVNFEDFLVLSSNFDAMGGWEDGDFDGSGSIEFEDFLLLSASYGDRSAVANVAVPESVCLSWPMVMGVLALLTHASRSRFHGARRSKGQKPAG